MEDGYKYVYVPPAQRNGAKLATNASAGYRMNQTGDMYRRREMSEQVPYGRGRDFSGIRGCMEVGGGMTAREAMIYPPGETELFANVQSSANYEAFDLLEQKMELPKDAPEITPADSIAQLGLSEALCANIERCKYTRLTPVQRNAIPVVRAGLDALVLANTGSGKTASFAIPIVEALLRYPYPAFASQAQKGARQNVAYPFAVIIVPTRELAIQTTRCFYQMTFRTKLRVRVAYGGDSAREQAAPFREGCDVLVGCPGRLTDFLMRGLYYFNHVQYLVIDEMDRLFDTGFEEYVRQLAYKMPKERQTLLFSATNPYNVQQFVNSYTKAHVKITIGDSGVCRQIDQHLLFIEEREKRDALRRVLAEHAGQKALVFTETKARAYQLFNELLDAGFQAEQLHGDMTQAERTYTFARVNQGASSVLVTTDVSQRGLDIQGVGLVVNYDLPQNTENYVHRIGRTGRVGVRGTAVSFVTRPYSYQIDQLVHFVSEYLIKNGLEVPEDIKRFCGSHGGRSFARGSAGGRENGDRGREGGDRYRDRDTTDRPRDNWGREGGNRGPPHARGFKNDREEPRGRDWAAERTEHAARADADQYKTLDEAKSGAARERQFQSAQPRTEQHVITIEEPSGEDIDWNAM